MDRSPVQSPELGAEYLGPGQADANGPHPHSRVFLLGKSKVGGLLVGANVQGTHHHHPPRHGLRNLAVSPVLVFLRRIVVPAQIEKLAAEQSNSIPIALLHCFQVLGRSDVGAELDSLSLRRGGRHTPVLLRMLPEPEERLSPGNQLGLCLRVRVYVNFSGSAVHINLPTVIVREQGVSQANHGGNAHSTGKNRRV